MSSSIDITSDVQNPEFGHAWRSKNSLTVYALVRLGASSLYLDSAADARALAAACMEAADAIDQLTAKEETS